MISTLLSFLVGFFIFIVNSRLKTERILLRLIIILTGGTLTGAIIGVATKSPMQPLLHIPWIGFAIMGFLTGILLFFAAHWSFFSKPGLQYFMTMILGLILAGSLYFYQRFIPNPDHRVSAEPLSGNVPSIQPYSHWISQYIWILIPGTSIQTPTPV